MPDKRTKPQSGVITFRIDGPTRRQFRLTAQILGLTVQEAGQLALHGWVKANRAKAERMVKTFGKELGDQ